MTLGQKIRQARIDRGMTQKELVGDQITRNMLSKIENDSATPSVKTLEYLSGRLGLSAAYFMSDLTLSDGTSPDGLDRMRQALRQEDYNLCISLLEESKTCGSTEEGYLLHTLSDAALARQYLEEGDMTLAKEHADLAAYYNEQGLYYSPAVDAEMNLILSECALSSDLSEFEDSAAGYERAVEAISFQTRYTLARVEYLIKTGEKELAQSLVSRLPEGLSGPEEAKRLYLLGLLALESDDIKKARELLTGAEDMGLATLSLYAALEQCYKELEDYKLAYHYAVLQKGS